MLGTSEAAVEVKPRSFELRRIQLMDAELELSSHHPTEEKRPKDVCCGVLADDVGMQVDLFIKMGVSDIDFALKVKPASTATTSSL